MTTLPAPMPDPTPGEIERGLSAIERHLSDVAPAAPAVPALPVAPEQPAEVPAAETGETRRVRAMRARVAEAHRLLDLQADAAPLLLDTDKVRRRRAKVAEAARLYELGQDPSVLAWRDQRIRRTTTAMSMSAAGIALSVSAIGVQGSVAAGLDLDKGTAAWWAAFGVEPALSLPLLAAVSVQAYSAMRGRAIDRKSPEGRRLFKTEALLLGLTLVLNCWPALPGVLSGDVLPLLVHALGPVAAVTAIWVLPTLWSVLAVLPMPARLTDDSSSLTGRSIDAPAHVRTDAPARPQTGAPARVEPNSIDRPSPAAVIDAETTAGAPEAADAPRADSTAVRPAQPPRSIESRSTADRSTRRAPRKSIEAAPARRSIDTHRAALAAAIEAGSIDGQPTAETIRKTLRCSPATARALRDELAGGAA